MKEDIRTIQAKIHASQEWTIAKMDAWLEEMKTCQKGPRSDGGLSGE
jgi:hypothetical protein